MSSFDEEGPDTGKLYFTTSGGWINEPKHDASLFVLDSKTGVSHELVTGRAPMSALAITPTRVVWSENQLDPFGARQAPYAGIYSVAR